MPLTTVISLTPEGEALARRLLGLIPGARHLHHPRPFATTVQAAFTAGERLVCICASGIVMRTLAPVLRDKHRDPAVLVLDQAGRHVIPLLSGHEGGGNAWGQALAASLGARCVLTSAQRYIRELRVAGLGCERGCPAEHLAGLIAAVGDGRPLDAIASIALKRDEVGLLELARDLKLPTLFFSAAELDRFRHRLTQRSDLVYRETGCYGVAEAAALAGAERLCDAPAELLLPKQKTRRATFALARSFVPDDAVVSTTPPSAPLSDHQ